jgi:hypothetical protein
MSSRSSAAILVLRPSLLARLFLWLAPYRLVLTDDELITWVGGVEKRVKLVNMPASCGTLEYYLWPWARINVPIQPGTLGSFDGLPYAKARNFFEELRERAFRARFAERRRREEAARRARRAKRAAEKAELQSQVEQLKTVASRLQRVLCRLLFALHRRLKERRENVRQLWSRHRSESLITSLRVLQQLLLGASYISGKTLATWKQAHLTRLSQLCRVGADLLPITNDADGVCAVEQFVVGIDMQVRERNTAFLNFEVARLRIQNPKLTQAQATAVAKDEDHCLIVAGAGTGKTTTMLEKVRYLVQEQQVRPSTILVLAFNRKVMEEVQARLRTYGIVDVTVHTFHSFGLSVLGDSTGQKPRVAKFAEPGSEKDLCRKVQVWLQDALSDGPVAIAAREFLCRYLRPCRSPQDFESLGDYYRHLKQVGLRTLADEAVKSPGELTIANWLWLHGFAYQYEPPYKHNVADRDHRQYQPDFYLPDHDLC